MDWEEVELVPYAFFRGVCLKEERDEETEKWATAVRLATKFF